MLLHPQSSLTSSISEADWVHVGLPTEAERRGHRVSTLVICAKHYNDIALGDVRF